MKFVPFPAVTLGGSVLPCLGPHPAQGSTLQVHPWIWGWKDKGHQALGLALTVLILQKSGGAKKEKIAHS